MSVSEPEFHNGDDVVRLNAEIRNRNVAIDIDRAVIADYLRADHVEPHDRLEFVRKNKHQIAENVSAYIDQADDVTGIIVGIDQLRHCRWP